MRMSLTRVQTLSVDQSHVLHVEWLFLLHFEVEQFCGERRSVSVSIHGNSVMSVVSITLDSDGKSSFQQKLKLVFETLKRAPLSKTL